MSETIHCPKCQSPMTLIRVSEQGVQRCNSCGGLWFDLREYEHLAEHRADVDAVDTGDENVGRTRNQQRDVQCPVCHVKMLKMTFHDHAHVQYESCPVCYGAYFDAGELKDFAGRSIGEQVAAFFRGFRKK